MWVLKLILWASCACTFMSHAATTDHPARSTHPAHLAHLAPPTTAATTALPVTSAADSSVESTSPQDATSPESAERGCPADCACTSDLQQEYSCFDGALEVVAAPGEFLQVTCRNLPALPAVLPALPPRPAPSAGVAGCAPPDGDWGSVLARLGARDVTALTLRDAGAVSGVRLASLPGLASLTLQRPLLGEAPGATLGALLAAVPTLRRLRVRQAAPFTLDEDGWGPAGGLEELELAMTALGAVPARAFRSLGALRRLGLWAAGVTALADAALAGLGALRVLELRGNALQALPDGVFANTPALLNLSLANNALRRVPRALQDAPALLSLDLSVNRIAALQRDDLASLSRLRTLNLDNNLIEELPQQAFSGVSGLEELSLRRNRLRHIAVDAFSGAGALRVLALSHNELSLSGAGGAASGGVGVDYWETEASPLSQLTRLQTLDVSHNAVTSLPGALRFTLLALRHLDLSHNRLQRLSDADVNFLSWNIVVDMRYNNISLVELSPALASAAAADPAGSVGPAAGDSGATVLLENNPLLCDCRLHELVRRVQARAGAAAGAEEARLEVGTARCAGPAEWRGRAVADVPRAKLSCPLPAPACPAACACRLLPGAEVPTLKLRCSEAPPPPGWPAPRRFGLSRTELRLETAPRSLEALRLPAHVDTLRLAGVGLHSLAGPAPPSLKLLDLRDNRLAAAPAWLLRRDSSTRLLLAGNPLRCDCDHADLLDLLQRSAGLVEDWSQLRCWHGEAGEAGEGGGNSTLSVSGVPVGSLCVWRWAGGALAALALLAAAAAAAGAVLSRRYEVPVRVWCAARGVTWCRARGPGGEDDHLRPYDAFVSYSHEDEEWVVSQLAARLERAEGRRLCLHFRDWTAGEYIPAQIARSVRLSRRTLVVLSPAYVRSAWSRLEWRAACAERGRVVVLLLGDVAGDVAGGAAGEEELDADLRAHLATNTYLKAGDPWFWDKLLYALPPRRSRSRAAPASAPDADPERDVARKKGFDDRIEGLKGAGLTAAAPGEGALDVTLTADGKLVNNKINVRF